MAFMDKISIVKDTGVDATGYLGGSARDSDHPYIKGYFYVFFGLPSSLFDGQGEAKQAQDYLLVSAESYTPPSDRTINLQDIRGQGGVDSSFITGQTISREFSIQYKDFWDAPIFRIHRKWTSYINPYLGASTVASNFTSKEYKGVCMVIQTKPVVRKSGKSSNNAAWAPTDIIKVDYFDGVQPMTDLKSAYDANIADNSFVKPTVQYKFDGFPLDETTKDVLNKATDIMNSAETFTKTTKLYDNFAAGNSI